MSDEITPDNNVVSMMSGKDVVMKADFMSEKGGMTLPSASPGIIDVESYARMFETLMNGMPTEALEMLHKIIGDKVKERKRG